MNYLDDFPLTNEYVAESPRKGNMMVNCLCKFGWIINDVKCRGLLLPARQFEALGVEVNMTSQRFALSVDRIQFILAKIEKTQSIILNKTENLNELKLNIQSLELQNIKDSIKDIELK